MLSANPQAIRKGARGGGDGRGTAGHSVPRAALRLLGGVLLLLVVFPVYALAPPAVADSPAEHLRSLAGSYYGALIIGGIGVGLLSVPLAFTRLPRRAGSFLARSVAPALVAPRPASFALAAGAAAGLLVLLLSGYAFAFRPVLLDATSQLVHARYLAEGRLAGPRLALPEFFSFQYMVNLPTGWVSQYPPGHIALLAAGVEAGAAWLVGPLLAALAVALTARAAEELLPGDLLAARLGTVFLAGSLFFLGHAATFMNHVTAAAFGALAVLGALRGRGAGEHARAWLVASGGATGVVFATRPVAGIALGMVALASLIFRSEAEPAPVPVRDRLRRLALMVAGSVPPLAALAAYNQRLFGSPVRFGYLVAEGPSHSMGFHRDPWGNPFGPLEGLAKTSRDLLALGLDLLVTPLSGVAVVGLFLLLGPTRPRALPILLLWALLPVLAHFFYWHQDLFMGPRLLTEFAPPWALLTALAAVELVRRTRDAAPAAVRRFDRHGLVVAAFLLAGAAAVLFQIPQRVALYGSQWGPAARPPVPDVDEPALVFVQGRWSDRLGARLAAQGMRIDSVRSALRHNTSCEVQRFLDARAAAAGDAPAPREPVRLHFAPRPGVRIAEARLAPTVTVRSHSDERPTPECLRQANADRHGALELPDLIWRGDLPGLAPDGAMFVRDLGPELNRRLLARYPERRALVYLRPEPGREPVLLSFRKGMELLWGLAQDRGGRDR